MTDLRLTKNSYARISKYFSCKLPFCIKIGAIVANL